MNPSRRSFLSGVIVVAAAATVPLGAVALVRN
jgi:hypothetical protein